MKFNFGDDEEFFSRLLCEEGEDLSKYDCLFDSRPKDEKRRELGRNYDKVKKHLEGVYGRVCQLHLSAECEGGSGHLVVDHLIPIQTNVRNKARGVLPSPGSVKVPGISYGSNHLCNLVLACGRCNREKWLRFLPRDEIKRILAVKNFPDGCASTNI